MFNIIEVTTATYNDTSWQMTFYYIATLAFLIGAFWTYYQVFIKSKKKKQPLKENIIYNNTEDVIEESTDIDDLLSNCDDYINDEVRVPKVVE